MTMATIEPARLSRLSHALPFALCLGLVPLVVAAAWFGGWWLAIVPLYGWGLFSLLDAFTGLYEENADPMTPDSDLFWYRAITVIWFPIQFAMIFGGLWWVAATDHLVWWEELALFSGIGVAAGSIGINYSHELMHQKNKVERWLADLLLATVLYSHFRSEHLLVHHRYVATPRDPVTARYGEGFWRFLPRVLKQCYVSAFKAEAAMLARKDRPWWDRRNPFLRYWALQAACLILALAIAGPWGLLLFVHQAFTAIFQLELVNYIEHYGLTRKHLGDGKYEHVQPRHSWNASHKASNWLLINLQRHSDHHFKPDRRFPLLQSHPVGDAPQLPYGYPVMTLLALVPSAWRRRMNPRVKEWRERFYPEITDWGPYNRRELPLPR